MQQLVWEQPGKQLDPSLAAPVLVSQQKADEHCAPVGHAQLMPGIHDDFWPCFPLHCHAGPHCFFGGLLSLDSEQKSPSTNERLHPEHMALAPDMVAGAGLHQTHSASPSSSGSSKYLIVSSNFSSKTDLDSSWEKERKNSSMLY